MWAHLGEISYEVSGAALTVQQPLDVRMTERLGPLECVALKGDIQKLTQL